MRKNIFKNVWRTFFYSHTKSLINPLFSWNLSLGLAGLIFLGLLFWSYQILTDIKGADLTGSLGIGSSSAIVDQTMINNLIKLYDDRLLRYNELTENPETFVDPSL